MPFFGCEGSFRALKKVARRVSVYCVILLPLALAACNQATPKTPVQVCEAVTASLLGFELPQEIAVSEQEIRGKRIVVHLSFKRPADNDSMKSICVYGVDPYSQPEQGVIYKQTPTRLAINGKQVAESVLFDAISKSGVNNSRVK